MSEGIGLNSSGASLSHYYKGQVGGCLRVYRAGMLQKNLGLEKWDSIVTLVNYRNHLTPIEQIRQLLSYAVGSATDEKLSNILEQVYSQGNSKLYVYIDKDGCALGIIGFIREGVSAEIQHIGVDERKRNCGIGRSMIDELLMSEKLTEITAETDGDAVEFYRGYGFEIQSLGERYPGVERFCCRLVLN
ncbi:GNAT family N-acetyltransferase [Alicyclobacillus sp. ALC3]|uniref:GNAT family N-acetyltransferase n=1 Tax=Alicyclobacillus sp. ALC3 TaxID=2796143 RepID=UPI002378315D|nr:GNAT family N-acetyltransferase [Alicyclobacillus sp. ALC3]WDL98467.1 GNAT family N-acetyltransferase [Alicyclobacillus sp. ALC3]